MATIALIGLDSVGASTALSLIRREIQATLLLVDIDTELQDAQVRDLSDAALFYESVTKVQAATHREASQADVVIITEGMKPTPGEDIYELVYFKTTVLKSILKEMMPINPNTVILVVANPVDLLTTLAQDITRLPKERVIGVGTCLDTLRLQEEVSSFLGGTTEETVVCVVGYGIIRARLLGDRLPEGEMGFQTRRGSTRRKISRAG
ncbi:hypothetical protein ASPTUDRAFT_176821 [Aspergillus tubingensis CBS 134.48]|uniref:Lactate/malate dehydrogenase N-terminal domain-containing protein n=1 Tax=Aspergillus tubingensis (strain CBS 134.48) TaxID=767770 RepID=A0A1L9MVD4_ASPTC|nr:hypothetical protein ASPTUDRAFT_176821 [Aspergillus tubingensis CBS 134.48]